MPTPVILPRQGQSVESCIIGKWNKKPGDIVKIGDILFSYETDKATFEEEAKVAGTLLATFFDEGDDVPVLTNVAVIGEPGENFSEFVPANNEESDSELSESKNSEKSNEEIVPSVTLSLDQSNISSEARGISPRAKSAAQRLRVDPSLAMATGPKDRIIERDIFKLKKEMGIGAGIIDQQQSFDENTSAAQMVNAVSNNIETEFVDESLTNIRKVIANTMHQSLSSMAQLTHNSSFDATSILEYRKQLKAISEKMDIPNITINDIIIFAVSRILTKHKYLNAHFLENKIRCYSHVHMGIAVDTPRGLIVPTLFNADTKSLKQIAAESKILTKSAQEGNINPDLLAGGTFTVSNLGVLGIESFTPVINPPQTGILGVNCIVERVRSQNGQITVYPSMSLSLTYDHRALDGAPASRFLMDLKNSLENFPVLLAGN